MKELFAVALLIVSSAAMARTNNSVGGDQVQDRVNNPDYYGEGPATVRTVQCSGEGDKYECENLLRECLRDTAGLKVHVQLDCDGND